MYAAALTKPPTGVGDTQVGGNYIDFYFFLDYNSIKRNNSVNQKPDQRF